MLFFGHRKSNSHQLTKRSRYRLSVTTYFFETNYIQVLDFTSQKQQKQTTMASVSRTTSSTVSNEWFTPSPVKSGSKARRYRPRRSAEQQARLDAAKTEHAAASHAAHQGEWVVKGKRHNKIVREPTPDEKAEAARIQTMQDLKAIEKTLSGSMSVIKRKRAAVSLRKSDESNPKKRKIDSQEKKPKSKSKVGAMNSFSLLAVDSTDDEAEADLEVKPIEIKPQDFPTLGAPIKVQASSNTSYSFALQTKPTKKQIGPEDFPSPPKTRVCWADHLNDEETSDEEDDLPMRPGQSWGDFA
jgi:hypothetical protein